MERDRNLPLDALKAASMLMIVILHSIGHTGLLGKISDWSLPWFSVALLYSLCMGACNVFVLISGYFLSRSQFRASRLLRLVLVCSIYSASIYGVLLAAHQVSFSWLDLMKSVLSAFTNQYWFITAYCALYLLSPFLNRLTGALSQKEHRRLLFILIGLFSVLPTVLLPLPVQSLLDPSNGKGIVWFVTLYLTGSYIARYGLPRRIRLWEGSAAALGACVLLVVSRLGFRWVSAVARMEDGSGRWYFDSSVPVAFLSITIFLLAAQAKPGDYGRFVTRAVSVLSASTIGVYLIHENPFLRGVIWTRIVPMGRFAGLPWVAALCVVFSAAVFCICSVIEMFRSAVAKRVCATAARNPRG